MWYVGLTWYILYKTPSKHTIPLNKAGYFRHMHSYLKVKCTVNVLLGDIGLMNMSSAAATLNYSQLIFCCPGIIRGFR